MEAASLEQIETGAPLAATVQASELAQAVARCGLAVPKRAPNPALSFLRLEVSGQEVTLAGTDLKTWVEWRLPTSGEASPGIALVPYTGLRQLLTPAPRAAETITIQTQPCALLVRYRGQSLSLPTSDPSLFPDSPFWREQEVVPTSIEGAALERLLAQVTPFASPEPYARPVLATVLLETRDGYLRAVATDGFRVAQSKAPVDWQLSGPALLPVDAANILLKLLHGSRGPVQVWVHHDYLGVADRKSVV